MNNFIDIKNKIQESKNIVVTAHVNPDGDAIGAGLALTLGLKKIGKSVRFVLQDNPPSNVGFLKKISLAEVYDENGIYDNDLTISVDCATLERLGNTKELLENRVSINIDHHISNTLFADINYVENISSTSEIIYSFLRFLEVEIDIDMGECLYTGLVNDTGNFQHDNVTEKTFQMAGYLKSIGVNNSKVVREFFNTRSFSAIKLTGKAMYEMKFNKEKKLAYYFMSKESLEEFQGKKEDTEGIVEKLLSLKDAEVSLFLREDKKGVIKGSMRSKHDIDVNKIAGLFNGGGHIKAAGFTSELPSEEIIDIVLNNL